MAEKLASKDVTLMPAPVAPEAAAGAVGVAVDDEQPATIAATATMDAASFRVFNNSSSPLKMFRDAYLAWSAGCLGVLPGDASASPRTIGPGITSLPVRPGVPIAQHGAPVWEATGRDRPGRNRPQAGQSSGRRGSAPAPARQRRAGACWHREGPSSVRPWRAAPATPVSRAPGRRPP